MGLGLYVKEYRVLGSAFRFRIQGFKYLSLGYGFQPQDSRVQVFGLRVQGSEFGF